MWWQLLHSNFVAKNFASILNKVSGHLVDLVSGKEEGEWRRVGGDMMYVR
jgi:hypothetical protein